MNTALYSGIPFSPQATITNNIGAADSIIEVSDVSAFPPAPNLATIGTDADGETILYTAKTESALSGCQRGVEGEARGWTAGELIGRNFTAKDHADLISAATDAYGAAIAAQVDAQTAREDAAAAGTVAAAKQDKLTGQPGQVVGFDAGGAAVAVHGWSNQNLLLNSDFRAPVNRNGRDKYVHGNRIAVDKWEFVPGGNVSKSAASLELKDGYVTLAFERLDTSLGFYMLEQMLPTNVANSIFGKTVTASVFTRDGNLYSEEIQVPQGEPIDTTDFVFETIHADLLYLDDYKSMYFRLFTYEQSATADIVAIKLELGPVQTLAHQDADGNWWLNDPPDYELQYTLCSLYSPSTGAWVGSQHSNPNLLDNWYFADPINQRGQTEYTGAGYTIDRWCSFSSSLTVSVAEDGVELSAVNSDWGQLIPPGEFPPGEYTVSILTSEGKLGSKTKYLSGDNANTALSTLTGAFGDTGYYCNLRREWSGTRGTLCAVQRRSGTAKLVAIKLELGPVQTLAHQDADGNWVLNDLPPNKALELAKCQRYYQPLPQYTSMIVYTNNDYEKYFDVIIAGPPMRIQGTVIHPEYIAQAKSGAIVIYSEQTWQHRVRFYSDNTLPAKGSLVEVQQNGCGISADL